MPELVSFVIAKTENVFRDSESKQIIETKEIDNYFDHKTLEDDGPVEFNSQDDGSNVDIQMDKEPSSADE